MKRSLITGLLFLGVSLAVVGCEGQGTDENHRFSQVQAPPDDQPITYAILRAQILETKCLRCHGDGSFDGDFSTEDRLRGYVAARNPEASQLYVRVANGSMPDGGPALSAAEVSIVKRYIESL